MKSVLITSSVLILVLIIVRYALRGRISLRFQYALWLLVAARLLIPAPLPGSALSILNTVSLPAEEPTVYVSSQGVSTQAPPPQTELTEDGREVCVYYDGSGERLTLPAGQALPAGSDYTTVPRSQVLHVDALLRWLWLAGAGVMGLWFLGVNLAFSRRASRRARRLRVAECPVPVYVSPDVPSPCLLGLVRQRIYLTPACAEDPAAQRHVLAHELTHRRHGDPWWSLVRAACLCLYWFDPLVWWAAALSRRDCELACDEGAIRRLGEGERLSYGRTLVDMVAQGASPAGLLQTATTMHSGKTGLQERIALIAKRPRMLAVTAVCLAAVVAVTVGCTFTGADPSTLAKQLQSIPAAYTDQVILEAEEDLPADTLASFYYAPDYDGDYGGWLFSVSEWDAVDFERHLCAGDTSGTACWARSGERYYAVHFPTDVRFDPSHGEDYSAVQNALMAWAKELVLGTKGTEAFTEEDLQALRNQPFQYQGNHITATYYPYYAKDGSRDISWTFVLSQPATQGEGGIWCVEQHWYAGEFPQRQVIRPDTDLTSEEYYAQLQSQANDGQADWATAPMEVCLRYAHSLQMAHENATAESFELSEVYSSAPGSSNIQAAESLSAILDQGEVTAELQYQVEGAWFNRSLTLSAEDPAIQTLMGQLTDEFSWVDTHWPWPLATDPWADETLAYYMTIHTPDPTTAVNTRVDLTLYAGSPYVAISSAQSVTGVPDRSYEVTPTQGGKDMAAFCRAWFDETRAAAGQTPVIAVETAVDALVSGGPLTMELRGADGQSLRRCQAPGSNGAYTLQNLTDASYFTWSRADSGKAPEDTAQLTFTSADGSTVLEFWENSDLVRCTQNGKAQWLRAESTGYDALSPNVFRHMRSWYDEVEWEALTQDVVLPDEGQDQLAVAQAWVDAVENVHLKVSPGSKYAYTYVRCEVALVDAYDDWYQPFMLETEHFYFSYQRVFVPGNEYALHWSMAGNTGEYDGSLGEAPEGAMMNAQMGPMYLTEAGWRCDGTGTGP